MFKLNRNHHSDARGRESVCVFRIGQFGDTVVALPAIHRIAQRHSGAKMTLITNAPSKDSFVTAWDVLRHTGITAMALVLDSIVATALACGTSETIIRWRDLAWTKGQALEFYSIAPKGSAAPAV